MLAGLLLNPVIAPIFLGGGAWDGRRRRIEQIAASPDIEEQVKKVYRAVTRSPKADKKRIIKAVKPYSRALSRQLMLPPEQAVDFNRLSLDIEAFTILMDVYLVLDDEEAMLLILMSQ